MSVYGSNNNRRIKHIKNSTKFAGIVFTEYQYFPLHNLVTTLTVHVLDND